MVMRSISYLLVIFLSTILPSLKEEKIECNRIETVNGSYISFSEMDKFLHSQMDSLGLPGLSIAIINDSKIIYNRTFGVTNIDTKEKVSEETLFDAGSMSKTTFTYLVMKMAEQGILKLDQPLYTLSLIH